MQHSDSGIESNWVEQGLDAAGRARVTVFGDFCLDAYWMVDPDESELSVETGLPVRRVRRQRYGPGGATNVAANLIDLGVSQVRAVGLAGDDFFGRELRRMLSDLGVDTTGLLTCREDWQTMVFAKPHIDGHEQNRIDFGGFNAVSPESVEALSAALDLAAGRSDAIILNQQVPSGVSTAAVIGQLNAAIARYADKPFVVDSRHRPGAYRGGLLKINTHEAAALLGEPVDLSEAIPTQRAVELAGRLFERMRRAVFVTCGAEGLIVADAAGVYAEPGIRITRPADPVGAGDTAAAAVAAVLGGGGGPVLAGRLANLAACVTVGKIGTTGTAGPHEIRALAAEAFTSL